MTHSLLIKHVSIIFFGFALWFSPYPDELKPEAWHLFAIFITTIAAVVFNVLSIFNASILALAITILTGTLNASSAYSGFSKEFILLIVVAFLISKGIIKSGLGKRVAFHIIKKIGKSTLGLGYATTLTDCILAPAFPSNTARSGVIYPIIHSLALSNRSTPEDCSEKKIGSYLMMNGITGLTISSTMWITGMAANLYGAQIAKDYGVEMTFASWLLTSSLPCLIALILVPWIVFKFINPEIKNTPQAPQIAQKELNKMGPMTFHEKIVSATFILMVGAWSLSESLAINKTAIAFLGLSILMVFNILTLQDIKKEGSALSIFIWFSILYTLSSQLSQLGFMDYLGASISSHLNNFDWQTVYFTLMITYIISHYLFVSQTAHMLALYPVFLKVGINLGVPAHLLAYMLIFATNFFSAITPQGSSANIIFVSSDYLETRDLYKYGAFVTMINTMIFLTFGSFWVYLIHG